MGVLSETCPYDSGHAAQGSIMGVRGNGARHLSHGLGAITGSRMRRNHIEQSNSSEGGGTKAALSSVVFESGGGGRRGRAKDWESHQAM